jgi:sugar/nucleoside kinase (ribokinase family)
LLVIIIFKEVHLSISAKEFFSIGHITNDVYPTPHVSGGVAYSAYVAKLLGYESHIITKCPENSSFISDLNSLGIIVHRLPCSSADNDHKMTTFLNVFDDKGKRTQIVTEKQEPITTNDLAYFPSIPRTAEVMIAPVANEVSPSLLISLAQNHRLHLTPQGFFRRIDDDGKVIRERWPELDLFRLATLIVLSDEDIHFNDSQIVDKETFSDIRMISNLVVLTKGERGSEILRGGEAATLPIHAFPLRSEEVIDLSGAGDSYTMAFLAQFTVTQDIHQAGVFASLYAALKIADLHGNGAGLLTAPSQSDVENFILQNSERYRDFLQKNNVDNLEGIIKNIPIRGENA